MNPTLKRFTGIGLILFCLQSAVAQYNGERVMEKSFEQTDFYFTPYRFVPFGIGPFKNSVPGLLDDPLLELDVNPARWSKDTSGAGYLTLEFRNAREVIDTRSAYFPYPMVRMAMTDAVYMPYPRFFLNTRMELEPAISAAYLFRPAPEMLSGLSLGVTYQFVTQDEKYYPIPQDIYKSVMGADYLGARSAGTENIPIVDKFSGADEMHQEGYFASAFAGLDLLPGLQVGAKLGRVVFDREGSYGSSNLWESGSTAGSASLWRNFEFRSQSYRHWEAIGGLRYALDAATVLGISVGRLTGRADQSLPRNDSSSYSYGPIGSSTDNWNVYASSGTQSQSWRHDGLTTLVSADLSRQVSPDRRLQLIYQYSRQQTDILLGGRILDTSFGRSRYQWDTTVYRYESEYALFDARTGSGTRVGTSQRMSASYQWNLGERVSLSIGGQFESRESETNTHEAVMARRHSRYTGTGTYAYSYFDSTAESKTLYWTFRTELTRLTIPVFLTVRISATTELLLGLNRSASNWSAEEVTLAVFADRVHSDTQGATHQQNFGERYTQPRERLSEVRTTLMAGLTVSPTPSLSIRFLGVPNYVDTYDGTELSDVQLWISVIVRP